MNIKGKHILYNLVFLSIIFLLHACGSDYTPKPRAYFRIDLPEKKYQKLDTTFPYSFEYPVGTQILPDPVSIDKKYWINIEYPQFNGTLHISYKPVQGNLVTYLEDSRTLVMKHIKKASGIDDQLIIRPEANVFGLKYKIQGIGAASPFQFFVTDSLQHFLRGALYFNVKPNNDSLSPVISYIEQDIDHLINTLEWK
jgi:gliding motility-associated lipoprotein GldD